MGDLHQTLNSVGTIVALLGVLWVAAVKMTRLEVKVETLWGFLLKRGVVEGVARGVMEVQSPVRLVNGSDKLLIHMADELREFYQKNCLGMRESEIALAIEKE